MGERNRYRRPYSVFLPIGLSVPMIPRPRQQVGKTRLQRSSGRYGDEMPAVAFDSTGGCEHCIRLPDREPVHNAVSQRDLDKQVGAPVFAAAFLKNVGSSDGGARHGSARWLGGFTVSRRR